MSPRREIGGIMPMDLPDHGDYYRGPGVMALNCGRAAIYYALLDCKPRRLHLPLYLSDEIEEPAQRLGIPCSFYRIGRDFLPLLDAVSEDEAVLWVNYYGVMPAETIRRLCGRYPLLLLDNTQAFFEPPQNEAYNLYSCRKFFGVADGGYLIRQALDLEAPPADTSYQKMAHRLKGMDLGQEAVYDEYVHNELTLGEHYCGMSRLTRRLMRSIDHEHVCRQRRDNYCRLYEQIGHLSGLPLAADPASPMVFPIMAPDSGFAGRIQKHGIKAVNWWRHVLDLAEPGSFEYDLADRLVQLPIDQRYGKSEMDFVAQIVRMEYEGT